MNLLAKNLMILASAGSGKTYQLSDRVIGLVSAGVDPRTVVALTFTRKAAGEFADQILMKLAKAARDEKRAATLRADTGIAGADYEKSLREVVRTLPEITLGTLDSFFSRIVRGFQHELGVTGGKFELLEGPAQAAAVDDILGAILRDALGGHAGQEFLHAFRRATAGREERGIADPLRKFVKSWHGVWRDGVPREHWGSRDLLGEGGEVSWEIAKQKTIEPLRAALEKVAYTRKGQDIAMRKVVDALEAHTTGSGGLGNAPALFRKIVAEVAAAGEGPLRLSHYKEFVVESKAAEMLCAVVTAAARGEVAMALERTRAVGEMLEVFDAACERRLRRRGRLGFDDVKRLMGDWVQGEEARLRREAVDFRLDARYEHWLLDEFQDTSRAEWVGIVPLLDEAASGEESSLFMVGDKKQAIYGWRGGEVGLFDEAEKRYAGGLEKASMPVSYRSCPEVLELVNRVCSDRETMEELFGEDVAGRWEWEHHLAAEALRDPARGGEASVEVVEGKRPERLARMLELMRDLGVRDRALTCGVLVRTNNELRDVADFLRAQGYDVVEEGRRAPAEDNPPGLAVRALVEWLAQPADRYAQELVAMSPFGEVLSERFGEAWQAVWEGLLMLAEEEGLAGMVEAVVEPCWDGWSGFARRRVGDVLAALSALDAAGGTPREAARLLRDLEVASPPGAAAVQVMTIHKAKGLGFDVVLLPEISDDQVPNRGYFRMAQGPGWVTEAPADWARELVPELVRAEADWAAQQRYEALCLLYVALTRAKRGLYVLLAAPPANRKNDEGRGRASLANWVARSCGAEGSPGVVFQAGRRDWIESVEPAGAKKGREPERELGRGTARRERVSPSRRKAAGATPAEGGTGRGFGTEVHVLFEGIGWLDSGLAPGFPPGAGQAAVKAVEGCLAVPEIRALFEPRAGTELYREQPFELLVDGKWMSGVLDRLHVFRDADGKVTACELLDYKTDVVKQGDELREVYAEQIGDYRSALSALFGLQAGKVRGLVVSTHLREVVEVGPAD